MLIVFGNRVLKNHRFVHVQENHYNIIYSTHTYHIVGAVWGYRIPLRNKEQLAFGRIVIKVVGKASWEFCTGRQTFTMMLSVFDGQERCGRQATQPHTAGINIHLVVSLNFISSAYTNIANNKNRIEKYIC